MKNLTKTLLALGFASAILTNTAFAQYSLTLDELGNGSLVGVTPTPILFSGAIGVDPISGIATLCYDITPYEQQIGFTFITGDVLLFEPGQTGYSDIVRFEQNAAGHTGGFIYFFSDIEPGETGPFDPADVFQLPPPITPFVNVDELGPEGNNFAQWHPTTINQPGYVPQAPGLVQYVFVSDVPEPNTLALLGLAGGLMVIFRRRQAARV